MSAGQVRRRILIIDDSEAIHQDFIRVLTTRQSKGQEELARMAEELFGPAPSSPSPAGPVFEIDSAFQGQEGVAKVQAALRAGQPYAVVFLDYRMPPGWNGAETLRHLRKVSPTLPVVLCSAYADYSWEEILQEFGAAPWLVELRKPFDGQQLRQLVFSLTEPGGSGP